MNDQSSTRQNDRRQAETLEQDIGFGTLPTNLKININTIRKNQESNGESRVQGG